MLIVLPQKHWTVWRHAEPAAVAERLLQLARQIDPKRVATSKRKPKCRQPKAYVDGKTARAHIRTQGHCTNQHKTLKGVGIRPSPEALRDLMASSRVGHFIPQMCALGGLRNEGLCMKNT